MAQVPYQPFPNVSPQGGGEQVSISTPGAAFGENIGRAVEGLGKTLEQGGGEIFQRAIAIQELANETEARNSDAEYAKEQALLHMNFLADNPGLTARQALPKFLEESNQLRLKYRAGLSNDAARRMFDASSLGFFIRNANSAATHAGEAFQRAVADDAAAHQARMVNQPLVNPQDPDELKDRREQSNKAIETEGAARGWGPEKIGEVKEKQDSLLVSRQIQDVADRGLVQRAWGMYQEAVDKKLLQGDMPDKLRKYIWNENEKRASKVFIDKLFDANKTDAEMTREVEQLSNDPRYNLGDDNFPGYMRSALNARIREQGQAIRQQNHEDITTVHTLVNNGANDYASVDADPRGRAALESMQHNNPKQFGTVKKDISTWAANRDFDLKQEKLNALDVMYRTDPQTFLDQDLFDPKWHLDRQHRENYLNLRDNLLKKNGNAGYDPYVNRAISYIENHRFTDMQTAGLVDRDGKRVKDDNWYQFWGYVDALVRDYQKKHLEQPPAEKLDEWGNEAFARFYDPSRWFFQGKNIEEYRRTYPEEERAKARAELRAAKPEVEPDDVQVRRWLIQKQWNDHHQGGGKKKEEGGGRGQSTIPD